MELESGIKVDVLTYNTEKTKKRESYKGMGIFRVGCFEILRGQFAVPNYWEILRLVPELKKRDYKIVNAHTRFFESSWWAPWLSKYLGAKAIFTDHTAEAPQHESGLVRWVARIVDKLMVPYLNLVYKCVTVVSRATGVYLKKLGMKRPMQVIYCGVDTVEFEKVKEELGSKKMSKDKVRVVFVGRMIPAKGADIFVEAARRLVKKGIEAEFVLAGDGEMYRQLKKHETEGIRFLGLLEKREVVKLLLESDILVHPSSHHEGLPITLLEAGAAGCAVIATNRGGVGELIEDGRTGLWVKPEVNDVQDKIERLIGEAKLRKQLAENLRNKVVEKFDWSNIARDYTNYLTSLRN